MMSISKTAICAMLLATGTGVHALTLTFDDVPTGQYGIINYYEMHGVFFHSAYRIVDHSGSTWGPPRSGSNVLAGVTLGDWNANYIECLTADYQPHYADNVGGYFSTEPGAVLQLLGYTYGSLLDPPVALATIGAPGESWNNVYVDISSPKGICLIELKPVTTDALEHFCMDDMTVNFVPEPSSLSILSLALASAGAWRLRRRR